MGKGTIISALGNGEYQVQVNYDQAACDEQITRIDSKISLLNAEISAKEMEINNTADASLIRVLTLQLNMLKVQKLTLQRRKVYIQKYTPSDITIQAFCADFTQDLTGSVGLIEIPGESEQFIIQPGYDGNAVYDKSRDGQLVPTVSMTPSQIYYNLAMLPGWQKWKPTFRYGSITYINGNVADVSLENAASSQQGLNVNQASFLTDVPIEYMTCDGAPFVVGDQVLILFENQDFSTPKIIGFKEKPKPCAQTLLLVEVGWIRDDHYPHYNPDGSRFGEGGMYNKCFVWDLEKDNYAQIPDGAGGFITYPAYKIGPVLGYLNAGKTRHDTSLLINYAPGADVWNGNTANPSLCNTYAGCQSKDHTWSCSDSDSGYGPDKSYNGESLSCYTSRSVFRSRECENWALIDKVDNEDVLFIGIYDVEGVAQYRNNRDFMPGYLKPSQNIHMGEYREVERDISNNQHWVSGVGYDNDNTTDYKLTHKSDFMNKNITVEFDDWSWLVTPDSDSKDCNCFNYEGYGYRIKRERGGIFSPNAMVAWFNYEYNLYCTTPNPADPLGRDVHLSTPLPFTMDIRFGLGSSDPPAGKFTDTDGETVSSFTAASTKLANACKALKNNISVFGTDMYGRTLTDTDWHSRFYMALYE